LKHAERCCVDARVGLAAVFSTCGNAARQGTSCKTPQSPGL